MEARDRVAKGLEVRRLQERRAAPQARSVSIDVDDPPPPCPGTDIAAALRLVKLGLRLAAGIEDGELPRHFIYSHEQLKPGNIPG